MGETGTTTPINTDNLRFPVGIFDVDMGVRTMDRKAFYFSPDHRGGGRKVEFREVFKEGKGNDTGASLATLRSQLGEIPVLVDGNLGAKTLAGGEKEEVEGKETACGPTADDGHTASLVERRESIFHWDLYLFLMIIFVFAPFFQQSFLLNFSCRFSIVYRINRGIFIEHEW